MDTKERLWKKIQELSFQEIGCASPGLYGILAEIFTETKEARASGTDGEVFYYHPDTFLELYEKEGLKGVTRFFLHTLFHVLYLHGADKCTRQEKEMQIWNLACDIVSEYTIDCLGFADITGMMPAEGQALCRELWDGEKSLGAEEVYERLWKKNPDREETEQWIRIFSKDCHSFWKSMESSKLERLLQRIRNFSRDMQDGGTAAGEKQEQKPEISRNGMNFRRKESGIITDFCGSLPWKEKNCSWIWKALIIFPIFTDCGNMETCR